MLDGTQVSFSLQWLKLSGKISPCLVGEIHGQKRSPQINRVKSLKFQTGEDYGEVLTYTAEVLHEADPRWSISLPQ